MCKTTWIAFPLVLLLVSTHGAAYAAQDLFSNLSQLKSNPVNPILRSRTGDFDTTLLEDCRTGVQTSLDLNFFTDADYTIVIDEVVERTPSNYTLLGHLSTNSDSSAVVGVFKNTVTVYVRDYDDEEIYEARFDPISAKVDLNELDEAGLEGCDPDWVDDPETRIVKQFTPAVAPFEEQTIDIMFLYTPLALADAGSLSVLVNEFETTVAEQNRVMALSGIIAKVRMVHYGMVDYDKDDGSTSSGSMLAVLRRHYNDPSDPNDCIEPIGACGCPVHQCSSFLNFMDDKFHVGNDRVQLVRLKEWVGADVVSLWVFDTGGSGSGNLFGNVVGWKATNSNFHFNHELGHAFGNTHNCEGTWVTGEGPCNGEPCSGFPGQYEINDLYLNVKNNAYSFGRRFGPLNIFRTIQSYGPGIRVPRYSNPDPATRFLLLNTGVDGTGAMDTCPSDPDQVGQNNALSMNEFAPTFAGTQATVHRVRIQAETGEPLAEFFDSGAVIVYGDLRERTSYTLLNAFGSVNDFVINNGVENVVRIDSNTGVFFLKGDVIENESDLSGFKTDTPKDFIVQNSSGAVKVVIDSFGNLRLTKLLLEYDRL